MAGLGSLVLPWDGSSCFPVMEELPSQGRPPLHGSWIQLKLTEIMERSASKLHKFLPVILGLGIQSTIPRIKDDDLKVYDGILKIDRDEREGMCQVLIFYSLCLMALISIQGH